MRIRRRSILAGAVGVPTLLGVAGWFRHRSGRLEPSAFDMRLADGKRVITSNGMPNHAVGDFPNPHDPVPIRPQRHAFETTLAPRPAKSPIPLGMWLFGVALNGVPFDPSGPFWGGDGNSGWQFEVLHPSNAVALGVDVHRAHTQGRGAYHYHGLPTGLLWSARCAAPAAAMWLLGFAADGFPIYGPECPAIADDLASRQTRLRSSYRLRAGRRRDGPKGSHDGTFVEDFIYEPGFGDLDECNGRFGPTPEHPEGVYYYVLTDEFPFIPRLYRGEPDESFAHGPPPGKSPPLPRELEEYGGDADSAG